LQETIVFAQEECFGACVHPLFGKKDTQVPISRSITISAQFFLFFSIQDKVVEHLIDSGTFGHCCVADGGAVYGGYQQYNQHYAQKNHKRIQSAIKYSFIFT